MKTIKLLYDGDCPLCRREIRFLQRLDRKEQLDFEDIASPDFDPVKYGVTHEEVQAKMHGVMSDGQVVTGVDVFRQAYSAVGFSWLVAPTRLPVVKQLFDLGYWVFARNRVRIGRMYGRGCDEGKCGVGK